MRAPGSLVFSPSSSFLAAALNWRAYAFTSSRHSPSSDSTRCDGMQPSGASPLNQMWRAPRSYSLCAETNSIRRLIQQRPECYLN